MELLMLCHIYFSEEQGRSSSQEYSNPLPATVLASQHLWHFCFELDPSASSSYLRSARLLFAISALECTPGTLALRQLENLLHTSSLRYFNSGDTLREKTSKSKIKAEMFDG